MSSNAGPSGNTRSGGAARNIVRETVESFDSSQAAGREELSEGEMPTDPRGNGNGESSHTYGQPVYTHDEKGKGRAQSESDLDMSDYVTDNMVFSVPDTDTDLAALGIPTEEQITQKQRELEEQLRLLTEFKVKDTRTKARLAHYENGLARLRRLRAISVTHTDVMGEQRAVEESLQRTRNAMLDSIAATPIRDVEFPPVERNLNLEEEPNLPGLQYPLNGGAGEPEILPVPMNRRATTALPTPNHVAHGLGTMSLTY
ncbi:hypothetical protein IFR05_013972 [Cadophora sp. M221]|nr:hypothetical protein IFR05_013972 [Cadophora sp. M221]